MKTIAAIAAALLLPAVARGNCYYPDYHLYAGSTGDDFHICLLSPGRSCPDHALLRLDTGTGEVVKITTCDEHGCFLDECVPPASGYQYGLAVPYECTGDRCGTVYYWPTSKADLSPTCTRTVAAPEPADGVPWDPERAPYVCWPSSDLPEQPALGCSSAGAVLGVNGALLAVGALLWRARRTTPRRPSPSPRRGASR